MRACGRMPAATALRPFGPAWYPTHRKGSLRSAARAAAPSLAAGRGHGLAPFAFRLAAPAGAGSAYPLGAPPPRRGTPLRAPLNGGTVAGKRPPLAPRCPASLGVRAPPPFLTGCWGTLFRLGPKFKNGSPVFVGVASSWSSWTLAHPLCGPLRGFA